VTSTAEEVKPAAPVGPRRIVVVTGLSGAGKTIFLRALEDLGFYCVDNIPAKLIPGLVDLSERTTEIRRLALGVDIREKNFLVNFSQVEQALRRSSWHLEVVFLEADTEIIARRFRETRRPHPLGEKYDNLRSAVSAERERLGDLRSAADRLMDTSAFTPHQLREHVLSSYGDEETGPGLRVRLVSFGFKYGTPTEADLVMDVRFLPNPYFVPELKPMSGLEYPVANYVLHQEPTRRFLGRFTGLLRFLLPWYIREGKTSLTVAVGCTGGRHRSPAIVERLRRSLDGVEGTTVDVIHRDVAEADARAAEPT